MLSLSPWWNIAVNSSSPSRRAISLVAANDPATSAEIREVRDDASRGATAAVHAFSEDEEAFFQAGHAVEQHKPRPHDSFDDLDAGYQPPTFWERLWGRKPGGPSKPSK